MTIGMGSARGEIHTKDVKRGAMRGRKGGMDEVAGEVGRSMVNFKRVQCIVGMEG